jgi:hypothetical protein
MGSEHGKRHASKIKRFFASSWFGITGSVLSIIWEAVLLLGAPIGIELPQDRHQYFAWGFVALVVCAGQAVGTLKWRNMELERQFEPKFEIVFLPENDWDSRPYVQTLTQGKYETAGMPMVKIVDRRYRVGIRNFSNAVVPSVHVVLTRCEPPANFIHLGHRLAVMDSNPPEAERDLPPSTDGSPTLWFDVVAELERADNRPRQFHFCFANPQICGPVDSGRYEITLRCEGAGVSQERTFIVQKEWDDRLSEVGRLAMK